MSEEDKIKAATHLAKKGAFQRCCRTLESGDHAENSESTRARLAELHPPLSTIIDGEFIQNDEVNIGDLQNSLLEKITGVMSRLPKHRSADGTGWRYEHVITICKADVEAKAAIEELIVSMATTTLPDDVRPFFTASRLSALTKAKGGIRPLGIGTVFSRMVGRLHTARLRPTKDEDTDVLQIEGVAKTLLGAGQTGVLTPGGQEIVVHSLQLTMQEHPEWIFVELDATNAFNTLARNAIFKNAHAIAPELLPWLRTTYLHPSALYYIAGDDVVAEVNGVRLESKEGCRQGDPLGSLFYTLGIHHIMCEMRRIFVGYFCMSYIDNVYLGAPANKINDMVAHAKQLMQAANLTMNFKDSGAYSPKGDIRGVVAEFGLTARQHGMIILGVPEGSEDYMKTDLDAKHIKHENRITQILKMKDEPQIMYLLLRYCCNPRITYWLRNMRPRDTSDFAKRHDARIMKAWSQILNLGPQAETNRAGNSFREQSMLPVTMGGCGLQNQHALRDAAWMGSWVLTAHMITQACPIMANAVNNMDPNLSEELMGNGIAETLKDSFEQLKEMGETIQVASNHEKLTYIQDAYHEMAERANMQIQRRMAYFVNCVKFNEVALQMKADIKSNAAWLSASHAKAGLYLQAIPTIKCFEMKAGQFRISTRLRLQLPLPFCQDGLKCHECQADIDVYGDHYLCCKRKSAGKWTLRHNALQATLHGMHRALGLTSIISKCGPYGQRQDGSNDNRTWDLEAQNHDTGVHTAIDLSVTHPTAPSYLNKAQSEGGAARSRAEGKRSKYLPGLPDGYDFLPMIFETYGRWDSEMDAWLHAHLEKLDGEAKKVDPSKANWTAQSLKPWWTQRLSVVLQKWNAIIIYEGARKDHQALGCNNVPLMAGLGGSVDDVLRFASRWQVGEKESGDEVQKLCSIGRRIRLLLAHPLHACCVCNLGCTRDVVLCGARKCHHIVNIQFIKMALVGDGAWWSG